MLTWIASRQEGNYAHSIIRLRPAQTVPEIVARTSPANLQASQMRQAKGKLLQGSSWQSFSIYSYSRAAEYPQNRPAMKSPMA